ncbi:MAG: SGNH/GDSL hydrolase family protein [Pseudomonadota bacterium]
MLLKTLALSPVLVPQALWTMARASRLPEAAGPRAGRTGAGPPLRLLILGDSSAAGVGAGHQSEALSGHLAGALARDHAVTWRLEAASGATVKTTRRRIAAMEAEDCDAVLIALGVNDTKNGVSAHRWSSGYRALLGDIQRRFGSPRIAVSGVPDLGVFPLLPQPLRSVLGARSRALDGLLREIVQDTPEAHYVPMDFTPDPATMAADGFHPGPAIYAAWAARAAEVLTPAR